MKVRDKLIQIYSALEVDPSLATFANRKQLQKLTYLIEVFGIDVGFRFSWYLHGPYNKRLTAVLYDDSKEESEREVLDKYPDEENKIKKLKLFLGRDAHSARNLELIVSIHYLYVVGRKSNMSDEAIIDQLVSLKPHFSKDEARYYLNKMHDETI